MHAQYRFYMRSDSPKVPYTAEEPPKEYRLLDCIIAKAVSEAIRI